MVPAFLAVTACGGGGDDTGASSSTQATDAQTTADTTSTSDTPVTSSTDTTTSPTTTNAPTTTDTTTGTDTGSDTTAGTTADTDTDATTGGQLPDCAQYKDVDACQVVGCVWEAEAMLCMVDCTVITDEATCDMAEICMWFEDTCYPPI